MDTVLQKQCTIYRICIHSFACSYVSSEIVATMHGTRCPLCIYDILYVCACVRTTRTVRCGRWQTCSWAQSLSGEVVKPFTHRSLSGTSHWSVMSSNNSNFAATSPLCKRLIFPTQKYADSEWTSFSHFVAKACDFTNHFLISEKTAKENNKNKLLHLQC